MESLSVEEVGTEFKKIIDFHHQLEEKIPSEEDLKKIDESLQTLKKIEEVVRSEGLISENEDFEEIGDDNVRYT